MTEQTMDNRRNSTAASAALYARAMKVMPGGSTRASIYTPPFPPYIVGGSGAYVSDADGTRYLDFTNNFFSLIHGHSHPAIVDAVRAAVPQGLSFGQPTETEVKLAEAIAVRSPSLAQVRFMNSGTEAVMVAIKAARAYTGRPKIAKMEGGYHGFYDHCEVSLDPSPANWGDKRPNSVAYLPGTPASVAADTVILPFGDVETTVAMLEENAKDLACVLFDPTPFRAGTIVATPQYIKAVRETTKRLGILLVCDEVIAFRLHYNGAHTKFDFEPDLVTLGKIIGGGLPVGAVAGRPEFMSVFDARSGKPKVPHGGTFTANPITMAAGLASMTLLVPDVYERINRMGDELRRRMNQAIAETGTCAQVTGVGSLFRFHPHDRKIENFRSTYPQGDENKQIAALYTHCRENGVLVTSNASGALSTPMTDADLEKFVRIFRDWLESGAMK